MMMRMIVFIETAAAWIRHPRKLVTLFGADYD